MLSTIQLLVFLLIVIAAVAVLAARLKIPPAILLVLTGVVLALVPGLPTMELAPEFVLLLVLPPIIYSSAVAMSWREFRFNLRPISLLAMGCVVFTTIAVAAATHWLLGFAWPVGFVLGRHRFAARRRGAALHRAPNAASEAPRSSSSKAKGWRMTRPRSSSIASRSRP